MTSGVPAEAVSVARSAHFMVIADNALPDERVDQLLEGLERVFHHLEHVLQYTPERPIHIRVHASTAGFVRATGKPWWVAAVALQNGIETQPIETLGQRGILHSTLTHELAHMFINGLSNHRCPLWLNEALAVYVSGEGETLLRKYGNLLREEGDPGVEQIEAGLRQAKDATAFEQQYLRAYLLLQARLSRHGLPELLEELKSLDR